MQNVLGEQKDTTKQRGCVVSKQIGQKDMLSRETVGSSTGRMAPFFLLFQWVGDPRFILGDPKVRLPGVHPGILLTAGCILPPGVHTYGWHLLDRRDSADSSFAQPSFAQERRLSVWTASHDVAFMSCIGRIGRDTSRPTPRCALPKQSCRRFTER